MHAWLCETVTGRTMADLVAARDAVAAADMVELRLDGVADPDVARALQGRRLPAIVTCRPQWEGGAFDGADEERKRLLAEALAIGAEYVDVEWKAGFTDLIDAYPGRIVVSSHDFSGVPVDLHTRAREMRSSGAATIKLAVTAKRLSDTLPLLDVAKEGSAVVIGMGDPGVPSRLLAGRFGSRWTYGGDAVAPGQLPAARMVSDFRFRRIGPETAIYGVLGDRATHSRLPVMFNAAFGKAGIDAVCVPLHGADADDVRAFSKALGMAGIIKDGASVGQAERQFEYWTDHRVPPGVMKEADAHHVV
jgi:3-dehydroquinate dehydratase/shikimate dehydrogenase